MFFPFSGCEDVEDWLLLLQSSLLSGVASSLHAGRKLMAEDQGKEYYSFLLIPPAF